jgi:hypothetical protein
VEARFFKKLKKQVVVHVLDGAEVAQIGRALDSTATVVEGEAEDRVVASSSPALGTTIKLNFGYSYKKTRASLCSKLHLCSFSS